MASLPVSARGGRYAFGWTSDSARVAEARPKMRNRGGGDVLWEDVYSIRRRVGQDRSEIARPDTKSSTRDSASLPDPGRKAAGKGDGEWTIVGKGGRRLGDPAGKRRDGGSSRDVLKGGATCYGATGEEG